MEIYTVQVYKCQWHFQKTFRRVEFRQCHWIAWTEAGWSYKRFCFNDWFCEGAGKDATDLFNEVHREETLIIINSYYIIIDLHAYVDITTTTMLNILIAELKIILILGHI